MKLVRAAAVVAAVFLGSGCGGSSHRTPAPASTTENGVTISGFAFHPTPLSAHVGETITVVNRDGATHTFTADDHSFDSGRLSPGSSAQVKLTKAGTFTYHCSIHSFMTGVIHVS